MSAPREAMPRPRPSLPTLRHIASRVRGSGTRLSEYRAALAYVARWLALVAPVAMLIGSAVALFLWSLERATEFRWTHPGMLWCLPLAGLAVGALYHYLGRSAEGGNNLIMDEIHEPGGGVPGRMAPLILVSTVLTHLFGGSAGREGTAVQMGGSIASTLTRRFGLDSDDATILLTTGIAAGFGAVFGTPLTGAVFALEVLTIGRVSYRALLPCLFASVIGDVTVAAWGIHHTAYSITPLVGGIAHVNLLLLAKVCLAAVAFGIASVLFAELTHGVSRAFKRTIKWPVARPFIGGFVVIALVLLVGTRDYLGLGVTSPDPHAVTILSSFKPGGATPWSWWWKLLFTAITLGAGFKGGEVTPLFFVGAALGNALALVLHAPVDLFAALGFVAVFAGATNTPLACTIMGIELFGADAAVYFATASFLSYLFSGHSGIYSSQRVATPKGDAVLPVQPDLSLAELRAQRHAARRLSQRPIVANASSAETPQPNETVPVTHRHTHHHVTHTSHAPHVRHHAVPASAFGQVRVYTTWKDKKRGPGIRGRLFPASVPVLLVAAAKQAGLPHAVIMNTRFGYTGSGPIDSDHPEYGFTHLPLCVELMGPPAELEKFCAAHVDLLAGRLVVFRHAEAWEFSRPPVAKDDTAASA